MYYTSDHRLIKVQLESLPFMVIKAFFVSYLLWVIKVSTKKQTMNNQQA